MQPNTEVTVLTQTLRARFSHPAPDLFAFEHSFRRGVGCYEVDVFNSRWLLAIVRGEGRPLRARHRGLWVTLPKLAAVMIPPFAVIEWCVPPDGSQAVGYSGNCIPPPDLPTHACVAALSAEPPPFRSYDDLLNFARTQAWQVRIDKEDVCSTLALRIKHALDSSFLEACSMKSIAQGLGIALETLSRSFRRTYGMSPVEYRARLRVAEAMRLLIGSEDPVIDVGYKVGFNDLRRFNRQFSRHAQYPPSSLRGRRSKNAKKAAP